MSGTLTDPGPYGDRTPYGSTVSDKNVKLCTCGCNQTPQNCPNR